MLNDRRVPGLEEVLREARDRAEAGLPDEVGLALVLGYIYGEGHRGGLGWSLGTCRSDAIGLVVQWLAHQHRHHPDEVRAAMVQWFP